MARITRRRGGDPPTAWPPYPRLNLLRAKAVPKAPSCLTKRSISLPVAPSYVSAAAAVPLTDPAFIQGVGGEQNPIASDGLEVAEERAP